MPTTQKTLMFLSGFLTSLGSVVVICSILGTQEWISSLIFITDTFSNGTIVITYGLFRGTSTQDLDEGLQELDKNFEGILSNSSQKSLHLVAILFLILSLAASVLSTVFTFYNSISNPYQTFLGPMGVYTWNGLSEEDRLTIQMSVGENRKRNLDSLPSALPTSSQQRAMLCSTFVFLTMVLFVGNAESNHLSENLSQRLYPDIINQRTTNTYGYSFWLILLVILLNIVTVVIIIFYQKARYQQKQQQRKPMEYAPRDGILF
ncbi:Clarin-3 [Apodemus speciosus]|uniref:Clarin-3 n=1 Tax=Apodemus speciosus TaxID=105296 RepID=A0ABQ0F0W0_APOSI